MALTLLRKPGVDGLVSNHRVIGVCLRGGEVDDADLQYSEVIIQAVLAFFSHFFILVKSVYNLKGWVGEWVTGSSSSLLSSWFFDTPQQQHRVHLCLGGVLAL